MNRRILSIGHAIPSRGIDHAGGQYVHRLLSVLARDADVQVVAPWNASNLPGLESDQPFRTLALGSRGSGLRGRTGALIDLVALRAVSILPSPTFSWALTRSPQVRDMLRHADVIDVQWTDYSALLNMLTRRARPGTRVVCTMHDVISEKWGRRSHDDDSAVMRVRARWTAAVARHLERTALRLADTVVVFSEKDRELLVAQHGASTPVVVVDPPLADGEAPGPRQDVDRDEVLFVGAMARPENHASAMWFLQEIWPSVVERIPTAHLTIAGSKPQEALVALAARTSGVTLTGYVEDLAPLRERAAVFVAPVTAGAGVKFKVIDAMLARVPVIATSKAQEGIGDDSLYVAVTDDPAAFADATVSVLTEPRRFDTISATTCTWAWARYGQHQFESTVRTIYSAQTALPDA